MAPLSKVVLYDDIDYENDEEIASGPHSMLFGVKENSTSKANAHNVVSFDESGKLKREEETIVHTRSENLKTKAQKSLSKLIRKPFSRLGTYDKSQKASSYGKCSSDSLSYLNENNFPDIINSTIIVTNFDSNLENGSDNSLESDTNATIVSNFVSSENIAPVKSDSETLHTTDNKNADAYAEELKKPLITVENIIVAHRSTGYHLNSNISECSTFSNLKENSAIVGHSNEFSSFSYPSIRTSGTDVEGSPQRRVRPIPTSFCSSLEEAASKRDSLEYEESLGILTPEQMVDGVSFANSRTPSSENVGSLPEDYQNLVAKFKCGRRSPLELPSPNLLDASAKDISLGLIDDRLLSNFTLISDTTMNLDLPLDSVDNRCDHYLTTRLEQTPSPEDLPLDPAPIIEDCKTEPTKSKATNSFITSITSITSLDTGYQGDGEMSRPGSRGPDHSPLTRRPIIRPQPRRPEPMTDSDFYTESDADILEEHPIRGDRKARIIDGTLYGADAQAAAEIYVNNRENMDSSGIFTDIEGNAASSGDNEMPDISPSPSDASSKTISNASQNIALVQTASESQKVANSEDSKKELTKRKTPKSASSSPASVRSPKHTTKEENSVKKYKMPKRNVVSKVKAVLESSNLANNKETNRIPIKKAAGRWDAVMNKISKTSAEKSNLKEVKSKLFPSSLSSNQINKLTMAPQTTRIRRPRPRGEISNTKNNIAESLNSSASDLSAASPAKRIGSTKKRADVVRVTQVLTAAQLSPRSAHKNNVLAENKKNTASSVTANDTKFTPKKNAFVTREKKPPLTSTITSKDCGRATVKGGRVSPGARPPQPNRAPVVPLPRTIEALTVLLQHLVFNLDAFQMPFLKKELERNKDATEKAQRAHRELQESFELFRIEKQKAFNEERENYQNKLEEFTKQHKSDVAELAKQHADYISVLIVERQQLEQTHKEHLVKLTSEFTRLQNTYEQSLEILREENDSIREEIDEKNGLIQKLHKFKQESEKLEKDYIAKEIKYKEQFNILTEEMERLKEENSRMLSYATDGKENKLQVIIAEAESLRAVLELKQNEVTDLRKAIAQANQKADLVPSMSEKVSLLTARCEDLQSQLESKTSYESQLISDNKKLRQSLQEEFNQSKRLLQHNEELQWKLCQNKEVVTRVLEQAEETRSLVTSSFNERHSSSPRQIERPSSFREQSYSNNGAECVTYSRSFKNSYDFNLEDISPPDSPKVKGVVEKSDSVSYVLEMEESPEIIANRIVRRSFRNTTPPKNTPMKSPVNKRPRIKIPPSVSASVGSISPILKIHDHSDVHTSIQHSDNEISSSHSDEVFVWHTATCSTPFNSYQYTNEKLRENNYLTTGTHNIDLEYNDEDIKLPTLPSEIGRHDAEPLPVPQHLARDMVVSESNSEDESTSSSSGHL